MHLFVTCNSLNIYMATKMKSETKIHHTCIHTYIDSMSVSIENSVCIISKKYI